MSSKPSSLPHEAYLSIFSHLTTADLISASQVNHRWHRSSLSLIYAHLYLTSSTQLSLLHKYSLIPRHSRLIRSITFYRIDLTTQHKLTLMNECRNLISITLVRCANLDSEFLKVLVRANMLSLERFCIWGDSVPGNNLADETAKSTEITDDLLTPMLEFCGNLRELRVCGAEITDEFLTILASSISDQVSSASSSINDETSNSIYTRNCIEDLADNVNFLCTDDPTAHITNEPDNRDSTNAVDTNSSIMSLSMNASFNACADHNCQIKSDNIASSNSDNESYSQPSMHTTCPHLITLDLTECFNVTAFGVAELFSPQQLPKFHVLILQYNPQNDLDLDFFEFLADNFKSHMFIINALNSKRSNEKNKALQTFARINKDLNILGKMKNNVRVVKRERKTTDDEILRIFGEREIFINESK